MPSQQIECTNVTTYGSGGYGGYGQQQQQNSWGQSSSWNQQQQQPNSWNQGPSWGQNWNQQQQPEVSNQQQRPDSWDVGASWNQQNSNDGIQQQIDWSFVGESAGGDQDQVEVEAPWYPPPSQMQYQHQQSNYGYDNRPAAPCGSQQNNGCGQQAPEPPTCNDLICKDCPEAECRVNPVTRRAEFFLNGFNINCINIESRQRGIYYN